jgi:hypothetical protein
VCGPHWVLNMVNNYVPPGFSIQSYSFTIMLSFCLGWVLLMFVFGLKGISAELRLKWNGREPPGQTSEVLKRMTVSEYKLFLIKADAFAGIPNPDRDKMFWFLNGECKYDFIRYLVNEHSFLAMVFADKYHPYSKWERLVSFFILNSFMLTLLIFIASGHVFKRDNAKTASNNEPTATEMALYEYFVLAPIRVVVSFMLYYIFAAPFDRQWSDRGKWWTNTASHVFMVLGSLGGLYALWQASMVIKVAADELQENLPNYVYSVMICGNLCEVFLIYLKFVDLSEDSTVPRWLRSLLIVIDSMTCRLLSIGQWRRQQRLQIEHDGVQQSAESVEGVVSVAPTAQEQSAETELPPVCAGDV